MTLAIENLHSNSRKYSSSGLQMGGQRDYGFTFAAESDLDYRYNPLLKELDT